MNEPARDFLFVQSTTEIGGAESSLLNLFAHSSELRQRSIVASLGFSGGDLPARLRALGTEVVELPKFRIRQPLGLARTLARLRTLIRSRGIKVVVGNGAHPQAVGGLAARVSGVKSVFLVNMIHHVPLHKNAPADVLALRGPCDLMLAISESSLATLETLRPRVAKRLFHWGTPMREVASADRDAARAELGVKPGELLVGVFGRLQRWKAQDVFVEAAARVAVDRPHVRFAVVGGSVFGLEPEYFVELRATAAARGLGERMVFTGFRTDVPRLMAACDVVCHTTRVPEPFGLVVIEAMSLGRAVIATRGGGPSEIVGSPDEGLLIPPDDPAALAAAITTLVDDPERRRRMGEKAVERVKSQFTVDVMASKLLAHLDGLLGTSSRSA